MGEHSKTSRFDREVSRFQTFQYSNRFKITKKKETKNKNYQI